MKRFFALLIGIILLISCSTAFSHSGRTDANGGHYDHSNGDYHYHHGHRAHYHPDGVCPYDDASSKSSSSSSRSMPSATVKPTPKPTVKITPTPTPYYSYYDTSDITDPAAEEPWLKKAWRVFEEGVQVVAILFVVIAPICSAFIKDANKRKRR